MALIKCADCLKEVSDAAPACPSCGRPIKATTVEVTGKKWKAFQLGGGVGVVIGLIVLFIKPAFATFVFIASIAVAIYGLWGAWWYHG